MAAVISSLNSLRLFACGIALACLALVTACGGAGAPRMESIEVTPANAHIAAGTTAQLTATAIYSDGSRKDVTALVTWSSSNRAAASISNSAGVNGLASATAVGTTTVLASTTGVSGQTTLTVTSAVLVSIEVTPPVTGIANGTTAQFTATGVFSDKSTQNLTAQVAWSSSNPAVAAISNMVGSNGLASAGSAGSSAISATLNGITSASVNLIVSAATLVSIQVTPSIASLAKGLTQQFVAMAKFSDGSTQNLTSAVSWSSSNPAVATISDTAGSNGLASAAAVGSSNIYASLNGVTSPAVALTVTPATLVSIQITPPSASIPNGLTAQFMATGVYTDGSTQNLTSAATWSSSNGAVSTISNAGGSNGLATSAGAGSTQIGATLLGVTSPSVTLTVTGATLVSIQVTPPNDSIARGVTDQYTATGLYTDGTTQNITSSVTWASTNSAVATVSNAVGSNGLATAATTGNTAISASLGAVTSPNAALVVTAATLAAIQITPPSASIANGLTEQFTATGVYTDGSKQNLTTSVAWSSSDPGVAAVSNAVGSNGLAASVAAGSTSVSASLTGITSPSVTLTVTTATLVSIQVTPPAAPSLAQGLTEQFIATGTYTDNSTQNLTSAVTWSSSNTGTATISNAAGSNGLASAAGVGSTFVSAALGGVTSPTVALSVSAAALVSIEVTPPSASVPNGLPQAFSATGLYTDGSTHDLTTTATWLSSNTGVALISNVSGSSGVATPLAAGTTSISASLNGITSPSAALAVTTATLVSIQVSPLSASIASGLTQQFIAVGTYTDGSTQNLTSAVTWAASTGAASISNAAGSNGVATALAAGSADISATLGTVGSPNATLTVTPATLASIQITSSGTSIPNGLTQQFSATGTYTDNSTHDLTSSVTWSSSSPAVASISNVGTNGLATALTLGTTNIGATLTGVVAPSVPLTVSAATLVSIQVSPANAAIAKGSTQQFFAIGLYTDGTQVDLTSAVTWQSSVGTVASVSNAAGSNGLASASAIGSTTITASFDGVASPGANLSVSASLEPFAAVWRYGPIAGNQATLIMDASGNLTVFGLWNGAWFGYNGTVQASGSIVSGTLIYNTGQGTCESCADQDPTTGLQPLANVTLTVDNSTGTLVFTDNTNSQTLTYFYADPSTLSPLTDLTAAQASWTTLVSGGEPSYPHYGGWGNPYPVSAVGYGGLGDCLNSGTISADIPALGIYTLTCTQAYDAAHGIGVFNPSTVVVATGLVFMNTSGQIFGAMSDEGLFENVSYPAGVFP